MATYSSTLAWKILCTEEPGKLQPVGLRRVGHLLSDFTFTFHFHALEKEMATRSSKKSQGQQSLVSCCVWGHTESDTTEAT